MLSLELNARQLWSAISIIYWRTMAAMKYRWCAEIISLIQMNAKISSDRHQHLVGLLLRNHFYRHLFPFGKAWNNRSYCCKLSELLFKHECLLLNFINNAHTINNIFVCTTHHFLLQFHQFQSPADRLKAHFIFLLFFYLFANHFKPISEMTDNSKQVCQFIHQQTACQ